MLGLFKSKKSSSKPKILVVDDEEDIVSTIQFRLKACEFEVVTAGNGKEGLEKAESEKPDLILLDINMPIMDGHEMLERLRNHHDLGIVVYLALPVVDGPNLWHDVAAGR